MADVALWLGPYMSISSQKRRLYKDPTGPGVQANHNNQNKTPHTTTRRPQIPQPDLRFVRANKKRKPNTQRGKGPNKNTHKKGFANGHSGLTTVSHSKTCQN